MHVTRADGAYQYFVFVVSNRKDQKNTPALAGFADCVEAFLGHRVGNIWFNFQIITFKQTFDFFNRNAMFFAFPNIACIPIEAMKLSH